MNESRMSLVVHYLILVLVLVTGIFSVIFFSGVKEVQLVIVWSMGVGYLAWGVFHHLIHRDFHLRVFFEYFFVSAIGVLPVSAILMQR